MIGAAAAAAAAAAVAASAREIEHGKFSGNGPFECTDCPFTVCLLPRLPVHPLPVHQLPAPRLPVPGHRTPRNERTPL